MSDVGKDRLRKRDGIKASGVQDTGIGLEDCLAVEHNDPSTIVIVGATGDLTARKLVPALFNLYLNNGLPDPFHIAGCGRTKLNDQQFREKMEKAMKVNGIMDNSKWQAFSNILHYRPLDYGDLESFTNLSKFLRKLDQKHNTRGNKIFYLALPPSLYKPVAQKLGQAGLSEERANGNGWSRLVIENPF